MSISLLQHCIGFKLDAPKGSRKCRDEGADTGLPLYNRNLPSRLVIEVMGSFPMKFDVLKLAAAGLGATLAASLAMSPAAQAHEYRHHHHYYHSAYNDRPLIVRHHHHYYAPAPAPVAYDPWHGPAPFITGPNYAAAAVVGFPFRVANSIFPAYGDPATNPLILVGAPVHVLAQAVTFPFYAVGTVFGAPPPVTY
jgi:hypothetical protein